MSSEVIIIGGGISGLAAAFYLGRRGIGSVIIEKSRRLGGLIKTDSVEGCQLEAGPDSFIATKPAVTELAGELGSLRQQIIGSNDQARRIFIVRDSKLVPMPQGMSMMVPGDWGSALRSPLFSASTKAGFFRELLQRPRVRSEDVSVQELVNDHFGNEILEYVTDPLLAGVYGGQTAQLSARSVMPRFLTFEEQHGSLIRAVRRDRKHSGHKGSLFLSFADGMQTLTDSIARDFGSLTKITQGEACSIVRNGSSWRIQTGNESIEGRHVVFACPAYVAAQLIQNFAAPLASDLDAIPYSSAILVTFVYERNKLHHPLNGFGFLVPQRERCGVAAATWIGTKFPSRIPSSLAAIRAFLVHDEALKLMNAPDTEVLGLVKAELRRLMGIEIEPRAHTLHRWPRSMPQYVVGHQERRARIEECIQQYPGLFLAGNAYDGVGIPDCIRRTKTIAETIRRISSV